MRIDRFNRLLQATYEVAPLEWQDVASEVAQGLELKRVPTICTTSARLSLMAWWLSGNVRIVIPAALPDRLVADDCAGSANAGPPQGTRAYR